MPITLHFLILTCLVATTFSADTPGALVVIGGGKTHASIVKRALDLAGGPAATVAVLPQASERADAGQSSVTMWREAGAREARVIAIESTDDATFLKTATLIWMPGGDQNRLMKALADARLVGVIRDRHRAGAVVGGTSAGAAVMSEIMITGEADLVSVRSGATKTAPGLSLWPEVIVDQHFLKRQRFNRLLSAVLDHPAKLGVGIDEETAVVVTREGWEVIGDSNVMILDARAALLSDKTSTENLLAATSVTLHTLRPGMKWKPDEKK